MEARANGQVGSYCRVIQPPLVHFVLAMQLCYLVAAQPHISIGDDVAPNGFGGQFVNAMCSAARRIGRQRESRMGPAQKDWLKGEANG